MTTPPMPPSPGTMSPTSNRPQRAGRAIAGEIAVILLGLTLVARSCGGRPDGTAADNDGPIGVRTALAAPASATGGPGPYLDRYQGRSGRLARGVTADESPTSAPAHVTRPSVFANIRMSRVGSDLVLDAEVLIDRGGSYWAYAELWAGSDGAQPIAFARRRMRLLLPGPNSIRLLFGGTVIRDANIDGPYLIRRLILNQVDRHPPREIGRVSQFRDEATWRAQDFQ